MKPSPPVLALLKRSSFRPARLFVKPAVQPTFFTSTFLAKSFPFSPSVSSRVYAQLRPYSAPAAAPVTPTAETAFADPPEPVLPEPTLSAPPVALHLFLIAGLVFAIVVVGGMTRLTESGLSITEWNVVSGVVPPLSAKDWEIEFDKYRQTPEWKQNNQHMSVDDFKKIFYWEWGHRILGRVIGLAFIAPLPYFILRRKLSTKGTLAMLGLGSLIGAQGALGWYMVKSGLDQQAVDDLGGTARVSQYRLAAHLGLAFLVYAGCLRMALGVGRDWKLVHGLGVGGIKQVPQSLGLLNTPATKKIRGIVTLLTGLIFITALSGAFVAGLDAGLLYNEFPLMGGQIAPPASDLYSPNYSRKPDQSDLIWRNMFENPTTVQFNHRVLATTTFFAILGTFLYARRPHIKANIPPLTFRMLKGTLHMAALQVALGISTLLYLVPVHLAATHQAGSLVLLSMALAAGSSVRRPGRVARELMKRHEIHLKALKRF